MDGDAAGAAAGEWAMCRLTGGVAKSKQTVQRFTWEIAKVAELVDALD